MYELISIIVPIYNVEQYLDRCISSLINQTYKHIEIILVDDGSPDRCGEICDIWGKKDHRIKIIHKINGGLSDARNAGLRIATGDYILFVDSDDWIESNMAEVMLDEIKKNDADICSCGIYCDAPEKTIINNSEYMVGTPEDFFNRLYDDTRYPVCVWNKLYKKELWSSLEFPVGKICEDAFTTYILLERAQRIVQINVPLYHYMIRNNSIMTTTFKKNRMDEEEAWRVNYEFMKEHHPSIYPKAFDFYLQKLYVLINFIPKNKRKTEFRNEYNFLKNILKKNFVYILFKSNIHYKFKIKFVLDYFRL